MSEEIIDELVNTRTAVAIALDKISKELGELKILLLQEPPKSELMFKVDKIVNTINNLRK